MKTLILGVRELQARLGEALRAVQAGARVIVTSRGRQVAVLTGASGKAPGESAIDRRLRRLAAEGRIRLGRGGPIRPFKPLPYGGLVARLLADRQ
jgi:prevent-host-death family protein